MPRIIDPGNTGGGSVDVGRTYDYTYPLGNNLKPGGKIHRKLLSSITARAQHSKSIMERRYFVYDKMDEKVTSYVIDDGKGPKDGPPAVIVPITYAMLDTMLTYFMTTFADGPIFLCRPIGPEDRSSAGLMELVLDNHMKRSKSLLALYVQMRDACLYGLGVVHNRWVTEHRTQKVLRERGFVSQATGDFITTGSVEKNERKLVAEYNICDNINPRCYFPDPSVSAHKIQDGEFVCMSSQVTYAWLLEQERNDPESWFNVRYLKGSTTVSEFAPPDNALDNIAVETNPASGVTAPVTLLYCYANIIPREWKVGAGEYPEKWLFCIANDSVVVRAQPLNLLHNMFPIAVAAPTFDGYTVSPVSAVELTYETQLAADKYYRTRMKTLEVLGNIKMVIDPYLARYDDAISVDSNTIRIREHVWGRGVEGAAKQLDLRDPAPGLLAEVAGLGDWAQRGSGAVDSLQGVVRPSGERRSATEMRDTRTSAVSRMQTKARIISLQSMMDIGRQWANNTQQFATKKLFVEFMGGYAKELQEVYGAQSTLVDPSQLRIDVDIDVMDSSAPGGEFLPDLINLFNMTQTNPVTAQQFDATKQLLDLYRRANVRGATQFLRLATPQVVPDQTAADAASIPGASPVSIIGAPPNG